MLAWVATKFLGRSAAIKNRIRRAGQHLDDELAVLESDVHMPARDVAVPGRRPPTGLSADGKAVADFQMATPAVGGLWPLSNEIRHTESLSR